MSWLTSAFLLADDNRLGRTVSWRADLNPPPRAHDGGLFAGLRSNVPRQDRNAVVAVLEHRAAAEIHTGRLLNREEEATPRTTHKAHGTNNKELTSSTIPVAAMVVGMRAPKPNGATATGYTPTNSKLPPPNACW
jgi:hypothetical protein